MKVIIDGVEYAPIVKVEGKDLQAALDIRVSCHAFDNITIRDYLYHLLADVWTKNEQFNGKRPFGDSGWEEDLFGPLVRAGFISGTVDEGTIDDDYGGDYDVEDMDEAREYVSELIAAMCYNKK